MNSIFLLSVQQNTIFTLILFLNLISTKNNLICLNDAFTDFNTFYELFQAQLRFFLLTENISGNFCNMKPTKALWSNFEKVCLKQFHKFNFSYVIMLTYFLEDITIRLTKLIQGWPGQYFLKILKFRFRSKYRI